MTHSLTDEDLAVLNQKLSGTDLKIILDLKTQAPRQETEEGTVYEGGVKDIAHRTDLASGTVYKRLSALQKAGHLKVVRTWQRGRDSAPKAYAITV